LPTRQAQQICKAANLFHINKSFSCFKKILIIEYFKNDGRGNLQAMHTFFFVNMPVSAILSLLHAYLNGIFALHSQ